MSRFVAAVVALIALLVAVQVQGPAAAAPVDALSAGQGGPFVGVWTGGSSAEAAALDDLGVGWARVTVVWSSVEPTQGTFAWAALDQTMAAALAGGRHTVLAMVRDNPGWAAATRCTLTSDPERQQLATFMRALATRYRGIVWQLYNEGDNTSPASEAQTGLGGCFATVSGGVPTSTGRLLYAKAIEAAATAVRSIDPTAQLATGGVASGNFTEYGGAFDRQFLPGVLSQLKQDNSLASLDYVTIHYYSSQFALYMNAGVDLLGRVTQLRQDMLAAGLTATELKPVISDELSYTGSVSTSTSDPNNAFNLAQRAYVPKLLARAAAADVRAAFWFWLQDAGAGLGGDNAYGLKDLNGTPKPAYRAMRYFNGLIKRRDQFVRSLNLSATSSKLEGYEFTTSDGRLVQIVWNQQDTTQIAYAPGTVTSVTDSEGNPDTVTGGAAAIGPEPRFVFYTTARATPTAMPTATSTPPPTSMPISTPTPVPASPPAPGLSAGGAPTTANGGPGVSVAPTSVPPTSVAPTGVAPAGGGPQPGGAGVPPVGVAGVTVPAIPANPVEMPASTALTAAPLFATISIGLISADPIIPGQQATLTLLLGNPGPIDVPAPLTVQDTLPPGLAFGGVVSDGWTCASDDGQLVTCSSAGALPAGSQVQLQLLVDTAPDAFDQLINTASVNNSSFDPASALPTTVDTLPVVDPAVDQSQ